MNKPAMTKRSSSDDVIVNIVDDGSSKKKRKTTVPKDKRDADQKTSTVDNGDVRQKKAFFAYFGKSYDNKVAKLKDVATVVSKNENAYDWFSPKTVDKKSEVPSQTAASNPLFIKKNANLPYVSSFSEESTCFPVVTHANWSTPSSILPDSVLHLNTGTLYEYDNNAIFSHKTSNSISKKPVLEPFQMEIDLRYMVLSIKKSAPKFPVSNFYKYLKTKRSIAKKFTVDNESMWVDKYKPTCFEEILGNNEVVKHLKKWLEPNKNNSKKSKLGDRYDDEDYFVNDSDSDASHKTSHNLAVLCGPSGCGKTSAVYAVAQELNANVIELNASCNRNGKRVITDLMEATQSHAVEKNCLLNMLKEKKKKPKNIKKEKAENKKMTIILIEDADIFFDNYDDGFLSAISTLAADSKRPLVLTVNDPYNNQLLKFFLSNEMILNFTCPPRENLCCFLQLMALNEGVIMLENEINAFIHPFKPDIRQSILQLQYVINTGEIDQKKTKDIHKKNINSIWWDWPYVLGCDMNSSENDHQSESNVSIKTVCQKLEAMSKLNLIHSKTQSSSFLDPQPFWHHLVMRDSACLTETHQCSDHSVQLSMDIAEWIHDHINKRDLVSDKLYPTSEQLSYRQRTWNISKDILEQIGLDYCNRKNNTSFDYLATMRILGQVGHQRNQPFGNLRHSKMFSYLQRINIDIGDADLKYFCSSLQSSPLCDQKIKKTDEF